VQVAMHGAMARQQSRIPVIHSRHDGPALICGQVHQTLAMQPSSRCGIADCRPLPRVTGMG